MNEIRTTKIDGQEFVPFKDYKRLLERNEEKMIKIRGLEEKIKELGQLKPSDYELVIANIKISDLVGENKKLNIILGNAKKEQKSYREHIEKLEEENKKLQDTLSWYKKEVERLEKKVSILKYIIRR